MDPRRGHRGLADRRGPLARHVGTSTLANFVELAPVIVLASGAELSVPLVSAWL